MKMRKGYDGEHRAKKELEKLYGKGNVIKVAIAQQGADFLVVSLGELIRLVEVKETKKNKYYPLQKEKEQMERIKDFGKQQRVICELWIYFKKGIGKPVIKHTKILYNPDGKI